MHDKVHCCRHAGQSRVEYIQKHYLFLHAWKRGKVVSLQFAGYLMPAYKTTVLQ